MLKIKKDVKEKNFSNPGSEKILFAIS